MEALIILIAEFLAVPVLAGISVLGQVVVSIICLVLELVFGTTMSTRFKAQSQRWKVPSRLLKWVVRLSLYSLSICIALMLLINYVFFDETIRFVADRVETKTGIEIQYDSVEGDLFVGACAFTRMELRQNTEEKPKFYIQAEAIEADLSIMDLLTGKRRLQSAVLSNANIEYELLPRSKPDAKSRPSKIGAAVKMDDSGLDGATITTRPELLDTPEFIIEKLILEEVRIQVTDHSSADALTYNIEINHFNASPIRSHFAIFDLLFRSNLDGSLNDSQLTIINTEESGVRRTQWETLDVPASILASMVGGPFSLFDGGMIDVKINDQWNAEQVDNLMLDWEIVVTDAHARLPSSIPIALKPIAQVWVDNINENQQEWEFGFELELSEAQFRGATSLNANQIWEGSIPVILKQVSGLTNVDETKIKETTAKGFNAFKGFLEQRRKKE